MGIVFLKVPYVFTADDSKISNSSSISRYLEASFDLSVVDESFKQ